MSVIVKSNVEAKSNNVRVLAAPVLGEVLNGGSPLVCSRQPTFSYKGHHAFRKF